MEEKEIDWESLGVEITYGLKAEKAELKKTVIVPAKFEKTKHGFFTKFFIKMFNPYNLE